jgi:hypothetical protein
VKAIKGEKVEAALCDGMKDGSPFGLAGVWENWKDPSTGEWVRVDTAEDGEWEDNAFGLDSTTTHRRHLGARVRFAHASKALNRSKLAAK